MVKVKVSGMVSVSFIAVSVNVPVPKVPTVTVLSRLTAPSKSVASTPIMV